MEFLIHGEVNVYHIKEDKSRYFAESNGKIIELKSTTINHRIENKEYLINKKEYIGVLSYMLKDADISVDIQKAKFNSKSLIKIAKNYHEKVCTDRKCIIYEKSNKPVHLIFSSYTGLLVNKLNFGTQTTSDYKISGLLGCRFEFENLFMWAENINLTIDFTYQRFTNYSLSEIDSRQ